jgi:Methylenetetrahydrofolate reductase
MTDLISPALSLEFFPPRDMAAQERLVRASKQLLAIQPKYVSVTFGAGGSTRGHGRYGAYVGQYGVRCGAAFVVHWRHAR